jgi:hypothetical protein
MSLNILKRVYSESEIENRIGINGEWKIEVVCPNGSVKKPLGDKWRKNLIQDRGLNIFNGTYGSMGIGPVAFQGDGAGSIGGYSPTTNGIASKGIIHSAYFGDSAADPFSTNNTFLRGTDNEIYWTKRLAANIAENTSPMTNDFGNGVRTMTRVWDFAALAASETKTVREIGISASSSSGIGSGDQAKGSQGTFSTNVALISRFVLPEAVTLTEFQFLRLYYTIKITIPALTTAGTVPIGLSNNGFDAWGRLRLIGQWSSIFDGAGFRYDDNYSGGINSRFANETHPEIPWSLIGRGAIDVANSAVGGGGLGALFLRGSTSPSENFDFPSVGSNFTLTYLGGPGGQIPWYDNLPYVSTATAGGSLNPLGTSELTPVNGVVSREATILYPANNPSSDGPIAGMFIFPVSTMSTDTILLSKSVIGIPSFGTSSNWGSWTALSNMAWYWQFTDETYTNKRSVVKDRNYGLVINFRQSVARG